MFCADAVTRANESFDTINVDVLLQIEKELDAYDLISMVFLLYEYPETALEQLTLVERVSKDIGAINLNLLYNWGLKAQLNPTWKKEFVEALSICQLNKVLRKLNIDVSTNKKMYMPNDMSKHFYVNPMKKVLYKLSEHMSKDNLRKLQNSLRTYEIDTRGHGYCELVFLELMCKKFITVTNMHHDQDTDIYTCSYEVEELAKIIKNLGFKKFSNDMMEIQKKYNTRPEVSSIIDKTADSTGNEEQKNKDGNFPASDMEEIFKNFLDLKLEDNPGTAWKSDARRKSDARSMNEGMYPIKNAKRPGVCYIINQDQFHPSKKSIELNHGVLNLENRLGSDKDKKKLQETMSALNFEVICHSNLDHYKTVELIKNIIQYRVQLDDSMFILCILSHGVKGHIYAADSVKIKVEDIQNLMDDAFQERKLYDIPKVLILQSCQVNNDVSSSSLVADAPAPTKYYIRKSHFLVYWATAPELEAYRDEKLGSIFIQFLCHNLRKCAKNDHLYDIFTKVTYEVTNLCTKLQKAQTPLLESTLRKKMFLQQPDGMVR